MFLSGLHLLLTYKCNARCQHCFLNASPENSEVMAGEAAFKHIQEAHQIGVNHIFIEGGEPFLFPKLLPTIISKASELGFWVGLLTNGFWATSTSKARQTLQPLAAAGLNSLSISTDGFHQSYVPLNYALTAAKVASELGLEADLMVCQDLVSANSESQSLVVSASKAEKVPVYTGKVVCRGRAVLSKLCSSGSYNWAQLTTCREKLQTPGRVHIGPKGEIHLCQGLLMGENALSASLSSIFAAYKPANHPLVNALLKGGPAELARLAANYGFKPEACYVDDCHLCYEVRRWLQPYFPQFIGPANIYLDKNVA